LISSSLLLFIFSSLDLFFFSSLGRQDNDDGGQQTAMRNLLGIIFCHPDQIWAKYPQTADLTKDSAFLSMIELITTDPKSFFRFLHESKLYTAISCPVIVSSVPRDSPDELSTGPTSSSSSFTFDDRSHLASGSSEAEKVMVIKLPRDDLDLLEKLNFQVALAELKGFSNEEVTPFLSSLS